MALKRMRAACSRACAALPPRRLVMVRASWQAAGPPNIVFGHGGLRRGTAATACCEAGRWRSCHPRGMATEMPGKDSRAGAPDMGAVACRPLPGAAPVEWLHPAAVQTTATTIAAPRNRANLLVAPGAPSSTSRQGTPKVSNWPPTLLILCTPPSGSSARPATPQAAHTPGHHELATGPLRRRLAHLRRSPYSESEEAGPRSSTLSHPGGTGPIRAPCGTGGSSARPCQGCYLPVTSPGFQIRGADRTLDRLAGSSACRGHCLAYLLRKEHVHR